MERSDRWMAGSDIAAEGAPRVADRDEVARARAGDTRAFEELYRRHAARIHGLTRRMMGPEWADELTQDVFVRAWEKLGTFRGEAAFGTWLYRLAINVVLTRRAWLGTQRQRLDDQEETMDSLAARPASPDLGMDFEQAMGRLPNGAREVFVLHDVEGYKHEEIAGMLGITSGTTKAQLHRARMLLRKHLEA
jgi:RNA polymerase sigma-70 factor (ECF subfamily)